MLRGYPYFLKYAMILENDCKIKQKRNELFGFLG